MNNELAQQKRVFLAIAISLVFFFAYDALYLSKIAPQENNITQAQQPLVDSNFKNFSAPKVKSINSSASKAPSMLKKNSKDIISTIKAKDYEVKIDKLGRIKMFYLNDEKFASRDESFSGAVSSIGESNVEKLTRLQLIDQDNNLFPLELRFSNEDINKEAFATSYATSSSLIQLNNQAQEITLTQTLSDLTITKKITFYPNGKYDVSISLSKPVSYFISNGFRPIGLVDDYAFHGSVVKKGDGSIETFEDGDVEKVTTINSSFFVASSDRYYTTVLYNSKNTLDVVVDYDSSNNPLTFIKATSDIKLGGYIGPKDYALLSGIDDTLGDVVEYGFFTFLAKPLFIYILKPIFDLVGNWGWAIVITTILIRFVMYPLTYKGMLSMAKLKDLQPKMKEIQAKYKDDKQKLSIKTMELYQKEKVNPVGGCLPVLLQIPVFFAMYRVFLNSVELKGAEWALWIEDLSLHDPYFILPLLVGGSMYIHQLITPNTITDPMQAKIMKFLPVIFTVFFIMFPAGLNLYWFTNNLFSMAQQFYINKIIENRKKS